MKHKSTESHMSKHKRATYIILHNTFWLQLTFAASLVSYI